MFSLSLSQAEQNLIWPLAYLPLRSLSPFRHSLVICNWFWILMTLPMSDTAYNDNLFSSDIQELVNVGRSTLSSGVDFWILRKQLQSTLITEIP